MAGHREENTNEKNNELFYVYCHLDGVHSTSGMVGIEFEGSIG